MGCGWRWGFGCGGGECERGGDYGLANEAIAPRDDACREWKGAASDVLVVTFYWDVDPASVGNDTFVVNGAFTGRYMGTFAFPAAN